MKQDKLTEEQISKLMRERTPNNRLKLHAQEIRNRLKEIGSARYDLALPETDYLPLLIHFDEKILGVVYGRYKQNTNSVAGRGVLVATDKRILLVDKKPLFLRNDELAYEAISGVSYSKAGLASTVSLHTRFGDIRVRTFNSKCAKNFVKTIEDLLFAFSNGRTNNSSIPHGNHSKLKSDD